LAEAEAETSVTKPRQECKDIATIADPNPPDEETAEMPVELPEDIEKIDKMLTVEKTRMEMADG
jgi:hypothetical protein